MDGQFRLWDRWLFYKLCYISVDCDYEIDVWQFYKDFEIGDSFLWDCDFEIKVWAVYYGLLLCNSSVDWVTWTMVVGYKCGLFYMDYDWRWKSGLLSAMFKALRRQ